MRPEERRQCFTLKRILNEQMRGFRRPGIEWSAAGRCFDALQRSCESQRIASQPRGAFVSIELTTAGNRELNETSGNGRKQNPEDRGEGTARIFVVRTNTDESAPESKIGEAADRAGQCRGDCHQECVPMLDMRDFVSQNAFDLFQT